MRKRRAKKAYRKVLAGERTSCSERKAALLYAVRYGGSMDPLLVRMTTQFRAAMEPLVRATMDAIRKVAPLLARMLRQA